MRAYLYTGADKTEDLSRLVMSMAALQLPVYVAHLGLTVEHSSLAFLADVWPIDLVHVRLPGLGLPCSGTPADEVTVQALLAVLCRVIAHGGYRLVILDGVREAVARNLLDMADLGRLICVAPEDCELAMT